MIDLYAYIDIDLEILGEAPAVIVSVSVWDFEEVGNYYWFFSTFGNKIERYFFPQFHIV